MRRSCEWARFVSAVYYCLTCCLDLCVCIRLACSLILLLGCRRAFYDKRLAQEVLGDALGDVRFPGP